MKVKNLPLYAFIAIIAIFSIGYFIGVYQISFAFPAGEDTTLYDSRINIINKTAKLYAENNKERFETENPFYITVDELVKSGYLLPDNSDGEYKNPNSEVLTFNDLKIRIEQNGDNINTKILD